MRRSSLLALLVAGCAPNVPASLGEEPEDRVALRDAPQLEHLATALDVDAGHTVEDMLRAWASPHAAPDPSAWFDARESAHAGLEPLAGGTPLRVLTYNVGLLDRWYPFFVVKSPHVDERREHAADEILAGGWDLILLQEVWEWADVERFEDAAAEHGYRIHAGTRDVHEHHGLVTLVREGLVEDGTSDHDEVTFEIQRAVEDFPGPAIERAYLTWSFVLAGTDVELHLLNVHATAFPEFPRIRAFQARELGLAARDAPDDAIVLVGGDLNAGPYYRDDAFGEIDGETVSGWWRNAIAHPLLQYYGDLDDMVVLAGQAQDVTLPGALPPFDGDDYRKEAFGDSSLCELLGGTFTATDCNSLYFEQYAGTEFPHRIDHLMVRDPMQRLRVLETALAFEERLDFGGYGWFELSDHYGVSATIEIE